MYTIVIFFNRCVCFFVLPQVVVAFSSAYMSRLLVIEKAGEESVQFPK